jgi:hypothetical protein
MRLLTVATVSYLYQAEVMINSAREHHPELRPTIIVADCTSEGLVPVQAVFGSDVDLLSPDDLGFKFIDRMREYYSALEFCSALKVLGSAYILQKEDTCLFLDPDMVIMDSLSDAVLNQPGEVVISCHAFSPYPEDRAFPNNLELFAAGMMNGGVLLTRNGPDGNTAIDWLVKQTKCHWFVAPDQGMYADQQWLSGLPLLFKDKTTVISDRGVNVAYWNLHEKSICRDASTGHISSKSGDSLRLMHFSGFPVPVNGKLSKHNTRRFDDATEAVITDLVSGYECSLDAARSKFSELSGESVFTAKPLDDRMILASTYWDVDYAVPVKVSLGRQFYLLARKAVSSVFRSVVFSGKN